ncbi:APC membrane recruitment protein 1 [Podarcis raffonei]|uniref:APC membrane recruitment protein 1 n=1 Tax=Podarcis raffonei TaxID=65483 RepID=UPI002329732B|nr:APC membrane recruitment protein 1 [Podarcis raffonei]XP_053230030.1 APC membrane recruitment protein 1 [Podarcis raffonei]
MATTEAACTGNKPGAKSPLVEEGHHHQRLQEENGAADQLSEHSDASFATVEPSRQPPPAGKLRKTAFKLFGGKRSICTLPSFFGGKNKGQGKGAAKKGLSKSKTHDGISDVGYEEANLGGGTDFPPAQLPSSQSALLGADASLRVGFVRPSASLSGSSEGFEKKPCGEKSLFLPRSKKGLRGLFNSIRRHRKSKSTEPERTELQEWTSRDAVAEGLPSASKQKRGAETQQVLKQGSLKSTALPPEHGEHFRDDASSSPGVAAGLNESREEVQPVANESSSVGDAARGGTGSESSRDAELEADDTLCANSVCGELPDALQSEDLDSSPPCVPSGDQLSLMFGDVTSLKSFDSFTGCGDIIAEPDIDSIAESATTAERGRDVAKRSSCLVTYQGGGEEMAMPDDIEEYLQQMWEGAVKADAGYETRLPELMAKCEHQGVNGGKPEVHLYPEGTRGDVDLLTPHSDQQESAPNSDEGYYDSTTPGPDDETGDGLEEIKKDRLPRDSYSGDALYEFYEPDDALMSPTHADESWFGSKVSPPEIFSMSQFLDFALPDEKDLVQIMGQKREVMETEEERLAAIQKQLLFWEMQREPTLKDLDILSKDQHHPREKLHTECNTKVTSLTDKSPSGLGGDQMSPPALNSGLDAGILTEKQEWKDFKEMLCPEKHYNGSGGPKVHSGGLFQHVENGSVLDSDREHPGLEPGALSGLENSVAFPFFKTHSCPLNEQPSRTEADFGEPPNMENEPEQAVNFSQALVEFTSSGTLFSSLSESLGSSDSGSAFTQNLPALPTMVTFDIVDVEQEGEGECEQHLGMNTDEDIAASFEAFDDSYAAKESFAECDERMFPGCFQSSFQSCNWGVTSLPRRMRLQEMSPPMPEPLSSCRRSRSLDTESLEFELASLQLSKGGFKPFDLWSRWSGCRKDPVSPGLDADRENALGSPEGKEGSDAAVFPWAELQQNVSCREDFPSQGVKPWDCDLSTPAFQSTWGASEQPGMEAPCMPLVQESTKEPSGKPRADGASDPALMATRPMARPSNLPLQTPAVPQEVCASHRPGGDSAGKKLAWVLPLGEKGADLPPDPSFTHSPDKPAMCKPAGVTQGMSQLHSKQC